MIDVPFTIFLLLLAAIMAVALLADRRRRARLRLARQVTLLDQSSN